MRNFVSSGTFHDDGLKLLNPQDVLSWSHQKFSTLQYTNPEPYQYEAFLDPDAKQNRPNPKSLNPKAASPEIPQKGLGLRAGYPSSSNNQLTSTRQRLRPCALIMSPYSWGPFTKRILRLIHPKGPGF